MDIKRKRESVLTNDETMSFLFRMVTDATSSDAVRILRLDPPNPDVEVCLQPVAKRDSPEYHQYHQQMPHYRRWIDEGILPNHNDTPASWFQAVVSLHENDADTAGPQFSWDEEHGIDFNQNSDEEDTTDDNPLMNSSLPGPLPPSPSSVLLRRNNTSSSISLFAPYNGTRLSNTAFSNSTDLERARKIIADAMIELAKHNKACLDYPIRKRGSY